MDTTNLENVAGEGSVLPVYLVPLTEDEVAMIAAEDKALKDAQAASEAAKASAVGKLTQLGLTEDEIKALIG